MFDNNNIYVYSYIQFQRVLLSYNKKDSARQKLNIAVPNLNILKFSLELVFYLIRENFFDTETPLVFETEDVLLLSSC